MNDRVPRRIGRLRGTLIVLIGTWTAIAPQLGPAFDFGHAPDETWALTTGQTVLQILPGVLAVAGGMLMIFATRRKVGALGGWLTAVAGTWLIGGPVVADSWAGDDFVGTPLGPNGGEASASRAVLEQLAFFDGAGILLLGIGAGAITRFLVRGVHDAYDADGERQLHDFRRQQHEDLQALRKTERGDRRDHRHVVDSGLELFRGPRADTRPMDAQH